VDPVSHLLFARMVGALRPRRESAHGVVTATVLGGIAPDIDAALMALGWDVYLRWHDAGSHALAGTPIVAVLTAVLVRTWASSAPLGALTFGAWLGTLSHVCFDLFSGASIRVLWPLSAHLFSAPVVAMADPLAMAVLVAGACALWIWPRTPRTAGALVMALLAFLCGVKLVTRARATTAYAQQAASRGVPPVTALAVEAAWGSWREWHVFDRLADGTVRAFAVDGWSGTVRPRFAQPAGQDSPFARDSSAQFSTVRNFVPAHPFAFATWRDTDEGSVVFWSDARFCWSSSEQADPQEGVPHQDVRPAIGPVRCALWFGGSLDVDRRPREALVWLGGHLQRRSPQRW